LRLALEFPTTLQVTLGHPVEQANLRRSLSVDEMIDASAPNLPHLKLEFNIIQLETAILNFQHDSRPTEKIEVFNAASILVY